VSVATPPLGQHPDRQKPLVAARMPFVARYLMRILAFFLFPQTRLFRNCLQTDRMVTPEAPFFIGSRATVMTT
jgi:hypothetical protein